MAEHVLCMGVILSVRPDCSRAAHGSFSWEKFGNTALKTDISEWLQLTSARRRYSLTEITDFLIFNR
jgi:hypothetical protein